MGQRLVADDMETGFGEGLRDREMRVGRRDDDDEIDALRRRTGEFGFEQSLPASVIMGIGQPQRPPGLAGPLWRRREGARSQFRLPVERDGMAVHGADEGIAAAADHGIAQLARGFVVHRVT